MNVFKVNDQHLLLTICDLLLEYQMSEWARF